MLKTVCLIGKPNTGKSSLFNILLHEKRSIIMDEPGITRDRVYGLVNYGDKKFHLIDTGGIDLGDDDFNKDILAQATFAIDEADLILFIVDGKVELSASDYLIRDLLMKSNKQVILVVNKIDNDKNKDDIYRFYELGFDRILAISCAHKIGIDELLLEITKDMNAVSSVESDHCKFCFIGRPNVGKSSLINALLNEKRSIVSDISGTTRDAIDSDFNYHGNLYTVIDTAGMKKKGRIYESVEKYSYLRSLKAIERSDVCVLVIDALDGITILDKHIAGLAINAGKALVICVNKWDMIKDSDVALGKWKLLIKNEFKFADYALVVFTSAKTKKKLHLLMPMVIEAYNNYRKNISTSLLNDCIMRANSLHAAPSYKGRRLKINFVSQTGCCPPKFTLHVNDKKLVHFSYERYLENQIRESFDLMGTPIVLQFKNKNE